MLLELLNLLLVQLHLLAKAGHKLLEVKCWSSVLVLQGDWRFLGVMCYFSMFQILGRLPLEALHGDAVALDAALHGGEELAEGAGLLLHFGDGAGGDPGDLLADFFLLRHILLEGIHCLQDLVGEAGFLYRLVSFSRGS